MAKARKSPTARTLEWLRKEGFDADVSEKWNHITKQRRDLFNCLDIVALHPEKGIIGIQATSASNMSARLHKIQDETQTKARAWLKAGGKFWIVGWSQKVVRRKTKDKPSRRQWMPTLDVVTLERLGA